MRSPPSFCKGTSPAAISSSNPPLYEWLLWTVQQFLGPGPLSFLVLRYALIAATGTLFYAALRRTVASQRLGAAFSLSLVLFYCFGREIHHSVSRSLALLAASLALFIAATAYAEQRTAARAFLLGLIIGIGLTAKWSFLLWCSASVWRWRLRRRQGTSIASHARSSRSQARCSPSFRDALALRRRRSRNLIASRARALLERVDRATA
jgi:4-amino-4-deoxy-L-arabinose transferase-like glycosyltransferase